MTPTLQPTAQDDLVAQRDLTDAALTARLRERTAGKHVYTYAGPRVVISINPYDWDASRPLYAASTAAAYRRAPEGRRFLAKRITNGLHSELCKESAR